MIMAQLFESFLLKIYRRFQVKKLFNFFVESCAVIIPFYFLKHRLPAKICFYGHVIQNRNKVFHARFAYPALQEFASFVKKFKKLGFSFVSYQDFMLSHGERKQILLTFDDGLQEIYTELHPYMKTNGIPYMIFIITHPFETVDYQANSYTYSEKTSFLKYMGKEQIIELKQQNVAIGFHTKSHFRIFDDMDTENEKFNDEISIDSRHADLLTSPPSFAYPYGAPGNYLPFDKKINEKYAFIFDTKGFLPPAGNHIFRFPMDRSKGGVCPGNCIIYNIKKEIIKNILKTIIKSGNGEIS